MEKHRWFRVILIVLFGAGFNPNLCSLFTLNPPLSTKTKEASPDIARPSQVSFYEQRIEDLMDQFINHLTLLEPKIRSDPLDPSRRMQVRDELNVLMLSLLESDLTLSDLFFDYLCQKIDRHLIPKLRQLGFEEMTVLTDSLSLLTSQLLPFYFYRDMPPAGDTPDETEIRMRELYPIERFQPRVEILAKRSKKRSKRMAALLYSINGSHLRRDYNEEVDDEDIKNKIPLLNSFLPELTSLLDQIEQGSSDNSSRELAREYSVALLAGSMFMSLDSSDRRYIVNLLDPFFSRFQPPDLLHQMEKIIEDKYNEHLSFLEENGVQFSIKAVLQRAARLFPDIFPEEIPQAALFTNQLFGNAEVGEIADYNSTVPPDQYLDLYDVFLSTERGRLYRESRQKWRFFHGQQLSEKTTKVLLIRFYQRLYDFLLDHPATDESTHESKTPELEQGL